ncbi:patched domain-containing protein 3-like [Centruroides vittatus]|uniref:patched domain-containing protein 3-like n=1 Tax=Centruroides vittatus TaxID=120091 RepID=UPI0035100221
MYLQRNLSLAFSRLGGCIGRHPLWFIFIPLIISALTSIGFVRISMTRDLQYLLTPINGRSKIEKEAIQSIFPESKDFRRLTDFPRCGFVILVAKDGGSMLRESIMDDVFALDQMIRNISLRHDNRTIKYSDICLKPEGGRCFSNSVLSLRGNIGNMARGTFKVKYPIYVDPLTSYLTIYAYNLGGVTTDDDGYVKEVKSIRLLYNLESSNATNFDVAIKWEDIFLKETAKADFENILVFRFVRKSWDEETSKITESALPVLVVAIIVMVVFGAVSCMTTDWITSKPLVGVCGALSPGIGVIAAFGFLQIVGSEYVDLNIAVPFLMLGVGMDDSFVLLSSWRLSDPKKSIEDRMKETYSEAALSVTITSVTNFLASCIGLTTPYKMIQIYSLYTGISVLFVYIMQITFFGGCIAIIGYREQKGLHALFFVPVKYDNNRGLFKKLLMEGIVSNQYKTDNSPLSKINVNYIFKLLGDVLTNVYAKIVVVICFISYLIISIYYIRNIHIAFYYTSAMPDYSYCKEYTLYSYKYFMEYPFSIQVAFNQSMDYSNETVQNDIEKMLRKMENLPSMTNLTDSWLKAYLKFVNNKNSWFFLRGLNVSQSDDFVTGLRDVFLKFKWAERYRNDVVFSKDGKEIIASRYILQSKDLTNFTAETQLMQNLLHVADSSKYSMFVHNILFFLYDMNSELEYTTIQCLCVSSFFVIIVFFALVPNLNCSISIALTIVSIELGVMGYMTLWNVPLNIISMISLVLSIGFSVDYSAHISYSYICKKDETPNNKLKYTLNNVGYPIVQGCTSTTIGVLIMSFAPSDLFVICFKIIFLVMVISLFHGILLLPVILTISEEFMQRFCKVKNKFIQRTDFISLPQNDTPH